MAKKSESRRALKCARVIKADQAAVAHHVGVEDDDQLSPIPR
jgi:hypothetical protein